MKILLISHNNLQAIPRGGERSMLEIINYLSHGGHNCYVVMKKRNYHISIKPDDYKQYNHITFLTLNDITYHVVMKIAGNIKPDILLTWGQYAEITADISRDMNIPYIMFVRAWSVFDRYKFHMKYCRQAASVIVNCKRGQDKLKKNGINSIVSYVPVDTSRMVRRIDNKILLIGLEKINGLGDALPAIMPERNFIIIDYSFLKYKRRDNIELYPFQKDMSLIWQQTAIHLFPLPIGGIGTGRTPIEAQARGIPTIVEKGCGAEEISGIVLDKPKLIDWKNIINVVYRDYDKLSISARRYIYKRYNKNDELEKVKIEIERVIGNKRGRALVYLSDGIGNTIETTQALRAMRAMGYSIDAITNLSSKSADRYLESTGLVNTVSSGNINHEKYSFFYSFNRKVNIGPETKKPAFDKNRHESDWHYLAMVQAGFKHIKPAPFIKTSNKFFNIPTHAVIFAAGCFNERWTIKRWDYFDILASYFKHVILLGASSDILPDNYKWPDNVSNMIGKMDLLDSFSLMSQAGAFIGNDTGLAHAAAALGLPTFVIFGSTSHIKNLPGGAIKISKVPPYDCQPCQYREKRNEAGDFMNCKTYIRCLKNLSPIEVIEQIRNWIYKNRPELSLILK